MVPEQEQALAREGTPASQAELLRALLASQHRTEGLLAAILGQIQGATETQPEPQAPKGKKK